MTVSVGPTEKNPSHVFSLSDGTDTIGFITCNRQGIKSIVDGWSQSPMPRTALKTSSGAAKYEDFELPFTSIIQDDFSGGMNQEDFEDDRTKYKHGQNLDTSRGDAIPGPLPVQCATPDLGTYDEVKFFKYQKMLYAIVNYDDGTAPKLYRNGVCGAASSNSADKTKLNTDQDLSNFTLDDCIAFIWDGPGSKEKQPWRTISSNTKTGTNDVITVSNPWKTTHTAATSWAIMGSNTWQLLSTTPLTKKVTDVVVCNDYVVFLQGLDDFMQQFQEYNNSGTWTQRWFESAHSADYGLVVENTEGVQKFWIANVDENTVYFATKVDYGTDWTLSGEIWIGNKDSRIQGMISYGDPRIPYVIKEDSFGSIENEIYAVVPIGEMKAIESTYNGITTMAHGVYLYFNMAEKIERYYDRRLDDVGPDRDDGMESGYEGIVRKLLSYPGRYYALVHTEGNTPSILMNNGIGWHPIFTSQTSLTSITDMEVQTMPDSVINKLWFDYQDRFYYINITFNPIKQSNYEYNLTNYARLETSWFYGGLKDVEKYWHSIKIHSENFDETELYGVRVYYKVDNDTSWTSAGYAYTSPIDEIDFGSCNLTGYRIKFRINFLTGESSDANPPPRILAIVIKGVIRVEVKKGWSVTVISDAEYDLNEDEDDQGDIKSYLDTWANSETQAAPLTLRHNISYYDNKYVFIDPASIALQQVELTPNKNSADRQYKEIVSFTMYEV